MVENGLEFNKQHYFILLDQLNAEEVQEQVIVQTLKIIAEELKITESEFDAFNYKQKDQLLQQVYFEMKHKLFC